MIVPSGTNEFSSIIRKDIYHVRNLARDEFEFIFDIGANIGFFSLQARILFPTAKIVAVEADKEMFGYLTENIRFLKIGSENIAIGNGKTMFFAKRGSPLDSLISERIIPELPTEKMETYPLKYIFDKYKCKANNSYLIKLNCEGAERFFIGDDDSERILKNARQISMMAHFRSKLTPFTIWPEWREVDSWLRSLLSGTHTIEYYCSNKNLGRGYYCAKAKNTDCH